MAKIYFYKLTADDGGAPCVTAGLLSLAICKPMIRSSAEPDDLIFGFAANSLHRDNRLIYIARVTSKLCNGKYYVAGRYKRREDNIYERRGERFYWRKGARHHGPEHLAHDLGSPPSYPKAKVLLSTDFRYFGGEGTADYKSRFPLIKAAIEGFGRGHRVRHAAALREALLALKAKAWAETAGRIAGTPTSAPRRSACHRSRSCGVLHAG